MSFLYQWCASCPSKAQVIKDSENKGGLQLLTGEGVWVTKRGERKIREKNANGYQKEGDDLG
jgi:hypothetical protein